MSQSVERATGTHRCSASGRTNATVFFETLRFSCIKCQAITFAGTIIRFRRRHQRSSFFLHSLHLSHPSDLNIVFRDDFRVIFFLALSVRVAAALADAAVAFVHIDWQQARQRCSQSVSVCAIHTQIFLVRATVCLSVFLCFLFFSFFVSLPPSKCFMEYL